MPEIKLKHRYMSMENVKKNYVSKDIIKDILKKYEKRPLEEGICFYKEIENLLEE